MANDYERGFADGFERGFQSARGGRDPVVGYKHEGTLDCACPPYAVCGNIACPRARSVSPTIAPTRI